MFSSYAPSLSLSLVSCWDSDKHVKRILRCTLLTCLVTLSYCSGHQKHIYICISVLWFSLHLSGLLLTHIFIFLFQLKWNLVFILETFFFFSVCFVSFFIPGWYFQVYFFKHAVHLFYILLLTFPVSNCCLSLLPILPNRACSPRFVTFRITPCLLKRFLWDFCETWFENILFSEDLHVTVDTWRLYCSKSTLRELLGLRVFYHTG